MSTLRFIMSGMKKTLTDLSNLNITDRTFCRYRSLFKGSPAKPTVIVEGNIGSGKTTLLEYFRNCSDVEVIPEPLHLWTNVNGHNALELLYKDPKRWSFTFNNYAQLTRMHMHTQKTNKPVKMLERSIYSTRHIFVEYSHKSGDLTGLEYEVLCRWYNWLVNSGQVNVDLIVYLQAAPEVCFERIKKRHRKEESLIPLQFIRDLHDLHEDLLIRGKNNSLSVPVLVIDANIDLPDIHSEYEKHRNQILCQTKSTSLCTSSTNQAKTVSAAVS